MRIVFHQLILLLLIVVLSCLNLKSQSVIGFGGGIDNSKFSGDQPTSGWIGLDNGYSLGFKYEHRFKDMIALGTELNYTNISASFIHADTLNREHDSLSLLMKSITIPLNVIVYTNNHRFYVYTGIQGLIPTSFVGNKEGVETDFMNLIRKVNLSAHFGVGMVIPVGKPYVFADLRYSQGLTDLNTIHDSNTSYLPRTKLFSLSFKVGILLPLGETSYPSKSKSDE